MTRLTGTDLEGLGKDLPSYDRILREITGRGLKDIALRAKAFSRESAGPGFSRKVAVVPVTAGEGTIPGFVESVRDILAYLGCPVFITEATDISGVAEALERGAHVIFMADDNRFIAVNVTSGQMADNACATARGYVAGLEGLAGGLSGKDVLVIGVGSVGEASLEALLQLGAHPHVQDVDGERARYICDRYAVEHEKDLDEALTRHSLIVEASPVGGLIHTRHIRAETVIAAPGIPLGLTGEAREAVKYRLIHDPLQIGVATMLAMAT